jgi:hypothetical protein
MFFLIADKPDYTGDWISFAGGLVGAIIGAIIGAALTLWGVWWTLEYNRKKDKADAHENEEIKRLSIMPYLYFKETDSSQNTECIILFSEYKNDGNIILLSCKFIIKNVGLGTAVEITFPKLYPFREPNVDDADLIVAPGESTSVVELQADFDGIKYDSGNVIWLTCCYRDLLGNKYKQDISFKINVKRNHLRVGVSGKPELQASEPLPKFP